MKARISTFEKGLFLSTLFLFCLVLIIYAITSLVVVFRSSENSFKDKVNASQNLFVDSIKNDILTGLYSETYRKCKLFFNSGNVLSIEIVDTAGGKICKLPNDTTNLSSTRI